MNAADPPPVLPDILIVPERTLAGAGMAARLAPECARFGRRGLLAHGRSLKARGLLAAILAAAPPGMQVASWEHAGGEPTLDDLDRLLAAVRGHGAEWVAGVGGGSVLDLAKAAAGLSRARGPVAAYHDGAPIEAPGVPFAAVPTTAGTGSEATVNAVLTNAATHRKKSIRADALMPRLVILDPDLLKGCPPAVIAQSGMDALTQAIEAYTSRHAVWWSDVLALKAIDLIQAHLEAFFRDADPVAPGRVLTGSHLAGRAFAVARLGVVHGLAHPLGVRFHAPHGLVCAVCLPHALALNRDAIGAKHGVLERVFGGEPAAATAALAERLGLRSPFRGQALADRAAVIEETVGAWSTKANPKPIAPADVAWLLDRLFG